VDEPSKRNRRIQNSNAYYAHSDYLTFKMLVYSMLHQGLLPTRYLQQQL